ncbi:MAG: DUF1559 domain-containing protein, partial [Pirellulaceae bacterium]|nr:DUF1559 domain-containing protein [Pirellulaceae bacterium]
MNRRAFTLLELIVCVAIIGLVLALCLPAIQYGREAARRTQCSSNLRQFALAVSLYESNWRVFPPGSNVEARSVHFVCLPYMEQGELGAAALGNTTLNVPIFRCPSDGGTAIIGTGDDARATTNYVANSGTWWQKNGGCDGPFQFWDDFFKGGPPFGAGAMTRGLSNTSGLSEIVHADGSWERMRVNWESTEEFIGYDRIDDFAAYCQGLP